MQMWLLQPGACVIAMSATAAYQQIAELRLREQAGEDSETPA
jgi:hypothetical protein